MSLGAMYGMHGTLWARTCSLGYWHEVMRSRGYSRLGVYALEAFESAFHFRYAGLSSLSLRAWSDRVMDCGKLERLWGVGRSVGIR